MSFAPLPSKVETDRVRELIRGEEARADALKAQLDALLKSIDHKKSYIAPIRRLPIEMLAELFKWSVLHDPLGMLDLAQVCRKWRHAAHVSPHLYSSMVVPITRNSRGAMIAQLFIDRSGQCPLDVVIPSLVTDMPLPPCFIDLYQRNVLDVVKIIHRQQHRLRSLDLFVAAQTVAQEVLSVCRGPAPMLEALAIGVDCGDGDDELQALEKAFHPCPRLRDLRLTHCLLPHSVLHGKSEKFAGLAALTLSHLHSIDMARLQCLLSVSDSLMSLKLIHWQPPEDEDDSDVFRTIELPVLTDFTLVDTRMYANGLQALQTFKLPAIKQLRLSNLLDCTSGDEDEEDAAILVGEGIIDFLERSGYPKLVSLELDNCQMLARDFNTVLRRSPTLESLSISSMPIPPEVLKAMSVIPKCLPAKSALVPCMQSLLVSGTHIKPNSITRLIQVRNVVGTGVFVPLRKICFDRCTGVLEENRRYWSKLDLRRLNIELTNVIPPHDAATALLSDLFASFPFP